MQTTTRSLWLYEMQRLSQEEVFALGDFKVYYGNGKTPIQTIMYVPPEGGAFIKIPMYGCLSFWKWLQYSASVPEKVWGFEYEGTKRFRVSHSSKLRFVVEGGA